MPRRITALVLFVFSLGFVLAIAQAPRQPPPIRPVAGRDVFQNYCASCHGVDGRGKGPVSAALREKVPDLTTLSQRNGGDFPGVRTRKTILFGGESVLLPAHGSREMPVWGPVFHEIENDQDLGNVRLENVISYIRSMQRESEK